MTILGIDPGTLKTGYGVIQFEANTLSLTCFGTVYLAKYESMQQRLDQLYSSLNTVLKEYKPDEVALETAFYGKNIQSTLKIGYARGVAMLVASHNGLQLSEYSPREVKKAIVGSGAASKEQVNYMVKTLLNAKSKEITFDESDALGIAICHAYRLKAPQIKNKNWKAFIDANPDRIIK